jgi:hypothetical protein
MTGHCCGSEILIPDSDPALALISESDQKKKNSIRVVYEKYIRIYLIFPQGSRIPHPYLN